MPESRNAIRHGTAPRELIDQLAQERPELLPWLRPLQLALHAATQEPWRSLMPATASVRHPAAPLMHGAVVWVADAVLTDFVADVLRAAFDRIDAGAVEPGVLIEAAVGHDHDVVHEIAVRSGIDGARLSATAQLVALPLLQACARTLAAVPATDWREHYCPVCGVLPSLVEVLGLDRARQLRCGRCGCAWATHVLLCPFCGEHEHEQLGSLVPEGTLGQLCWVETCSTCRGYWKARAVLRAAPPDMLLLDDARTLELDLIALDRGYAKPTHGFGTRVRVSAVPVVEIAND